MTVPESDLEGISDARQRAAEILRALELPADQQGASVRGDFVAAWDYSTGPDSMLGIYTVGNTGATLVGHAAIPAHRRTAAASSLRRLGLRVGGTYGGHQLIWVADDRGCSVWSRDTLRVEGTGVELNLAGRSVHTSDVRAVVSFIDDDLIHRGVSLELRDGKNVVFVDEYDEVAQLDPTYGRNDLLMSDARWVSVLGRDLAAWLHVPHRDLAFG